MLRRHLSVRKQATRPVAWKMLSVNYPRASEKEKGICNPRAAADHVQKIAVATPSGTDACSDIAQDAGNVNYLDISTNFLQAEGNTALLETATLRLPGSNSQGQGGKEEKEDEEAQQNWTNLAPGDVNSERALSRCCFFLSLSFPLFIEPICSLTGYCMLQRSADRR